MEKFNLLDPKPHRYVLIEGRKEYLPDLVEQIIRDHIVPVMENETQEEKTKRFNGYTEMKGKKIDGLTFGELSALRRGLHTLDPMVIVDISKEVMKTDLKKKSVFETGKR